MNSRSTANAMRNERVFRSLSYMLVFLIMACGAMIIGNLIHRLLPGWHSGLIAGVMLFIVIDRLYIHQQLKTLTPLSSEWAISLGAQWVVIVFFTRILLSYANGIDSFKTDLSLLARGDFLNLLTLEFVLTLFLAPLVWSLSGQFFDLLDEIGLDQTLALREDSASVQSEIVPAHQRLVNLVFSIGIALVILTVLMRLDVRTNPRGFLSVEINRFSGAEAGALLYFVFGLALLSLSRLMSLQTQWNRRRIPVSSKNLTRQWGVYSLFFLLILAVVVSLLPAGDSLGFFSVLGTLFGFLIGIFIFLSQLIVVIILLLFSLPFLLLGKAPPFLNRPVAMPLPTLPVQLEFPFTMSATWALIRSILLWGSLLVIILFSLIHFVRQHDDILAALRKSRVINWLLLAWQRLYKNADQTRGRLSRAIAEGWQGILLRLDRKRIVSRPGWISLRSLDARRRIYFFYLAMLRRSSEQGLTRKPSQTPSEYAVTLEKALPSAGEDIDSITEAFMEARYSRQEVDSRKAELVKATWGRIRRALQSKPRNEQYENK